MNTMNIPLPKASWLRAIWFSVEMLLVKLHIVCGPCGNVRFTKDWKTCDQCPMNGAWLRNCGKCEDIW